MDRVRLTAILIAGPTASGKSALAIELARRLGGTVVNADSMQVYRDLRVLTARPAVEEEAAVPHRLFGHVDGAVNYSVGRYLDDARAAAATLSARGLLPVFAGGTGLYFKALLRGLSDIPRVPEDVRARIRALDADLPGDALHALLAARDPLMAERLKPNDRQRILRALEVLEASGRSLAAFQSARGTPAFDAAGCVAIFLAPDRATLYSRIDARFDTMMRAGALEEVRALAARRLDPALPVMRAHGVPGLAAYLRGEIALEDAVARGKLDTRHYAKRQFTWFRHQLDEFDWVAPEAALDRVLERIEAPAGR